MKTLLSRQRRLAQLLIAIFALLAEPVFQVSAEPAEEQLIAPGKGIGKTHLGPNGAASIKDLPKPNAADPGMSQNRLIWVSGKAPEINTLFIHTVANGVINAKPAEGVTIDEIRVTATELRTAEDIKCSSTFAQIHKAFPDIQPAPDTSGAIYQDAAKGIAFEFTDAPKDDSPCIAITVFAPNSPRITARDQVANLLKDKP